MHVMILELISTPLSLTLQGSIFIPSGETIDREDPFLQIDSLGRGVLSFRIEAVNQATTGSFTATATVRCTILLQQLAFSPDSCL